MTHNKLINNDIMEKIVKRVEIYRNINISKTQIKHIVI